MGLLRVMARRGLERNAFSALLRPGEHLEHVVHGVMDTIGRDRRLAVGIIDHSLLVALKGPKEHVSIRCGLNALTRLEYYDVDAGGGRCRYPIGFRFPSPITPQLISPSRDS